MGRNHAAPRASVSSSSFVGPARIFVSYARVDQAYRLALSKHLAAQRNLELIDDWHDGDVIPGDHWDREIRRKLDSANIIVLLLSADFFNSDYIHRVEIPCDG